MSIDYLQQLQALLGDEHRRETNSARKGIRKDDPRSLREGFDLGSVKDRFVGPLLSRARDGGKARSPKEIGNLLSHYGPHGEGRIIDAANQQVVLIGCIILAALLVFFAVGIVRLGSEEHPAVEQALATTGTTLSGEDATIVDEPSAPAISPDMETLAAFLDEDEISKLLDRAGSDEDARWIAENPQSLSNEDYEVFRKFMKLAANEPQASSFVREHAEGASTEARLGSKYLAVSADGPETAYPHLYQWDRRWGQTVYSSAPFGITGCGPTSLSIVYEGLTGQSNLTPYQMGLIAQSCGYMDAYNGTEVSFFLDVAPAIGLNCNVAYPNADTILKNLNQGNAIIANFAPGYFTEGGHFTVLAGLAEDGSVIMNDPYSYERSQQLWDANFLAGESRMLFIFSK